MKMGLQNDGGELPFNVLHQFIGAHGLVVCYLLKDGELSLDELSQKLGDAVNREVRPHSIKPKLKNLLLHDIVQSDHRGQVGFYTLTDKGKDLIIVLQDLVDWGLEWD